MAKLFKVVSVILVGVLLLTGVAVTGCGKKVEMKAPDVSLTNVAMGPYTDFDDVTIDTISKSGGETGFKAVQVGTLFSTKPKYTSYDDLNATEKAQIDTAIANFRASVYAQIAAITVNGTINGTALVNNPAYTQLLTLQSMSWLGKVAKDGWKAMDAFYATWPSGEQGFRNYLAAQRGFTAAYQNLSTANRTLVDGDLAAFIASVGDGGLAAGGAAAATVGAAVGPVAAAAAGAAMALNKTAADGALDVYNAVLAIPMPAAIAGAAQKAALAAWAGGAGAVAAAAGAAAGQVAFMGPIMSNAAFLQLEVITVQSGTYKGKTPADCWKEYVIANKDAFDAFYIWIAKPSVVASAAMAVFIRMSCPTFTFKVTNPNDVVITLQDAFINCEISGVKMASLALSGGIAGVPADGTVNLSYYIPVNFYTDMVGLIMAGYSSTNAMIALTPLWAKVTAGTATWDVNVDLTASSELGTVSTSYNLSWTPPVS